MTRFLNKVKFYYIPAIKDRRIFEQLLGDIYRCIAHHDEFSTSLRTFADSLRARTSELSDGLLAGIGLRSVIAPPSDLTGLFKSLDFETNAGGDESYSLMLQRGDGIQMMHIPEILSFISQISRQDYHIWGFEEPENSLELATAVQEASRFVRYASHPDKQLIVTSHSPAFFSQDHASVARLFVSRTSQGPHGAKASPTSKIVPIPAGDQEQPGELMGDVPFLPLLASFLRKAKADIERLESERVQLDDTLSSSTRSIMFVEGASDKIVFEKAWSVFVDSPMPFDVVACSGTTKMGSLSRDGLVLATLAPERKIYVLVDNDKEGRDAYSNKNLDKGGRWVLQNSNKTKWCRLPYTEEFKQVMRKLGLQPPHWPGTLENLFSDSLRRRAMAEGAYGVDSAPHAELIVPECGKKIFPLAKDEEAAEYLYIMAPAPELKETFANWLVSQTSECEEIFAPLKDVFRGLALEFGIQGASPMGSQPLPSNESNSDLEAAGGSGGDMAAVVEE